MLLYYILNPSLLFANSYTVVCLVDLCSWGQVLGKQTLSPGLNRIGQPPLKALSLAHYFDEKHTCSNCTAMNSSVHSRCIDSIITCHQGCIQNSFCQIVLLVSLDLSDPNLLELSAKQESTWKSIVLQACDALYEKKQKTKSVLKCTHTF